MRQLKHWQDPVNTLLGVLLLVSPWLLGHADHKIIMANAVIAGGLLALDGFGATLAPRPWEEWVAAALGLWITCSPWVLGFGNIDGATAIAFGIGFVVLVLAVWAAASDQGWTPIGGGAH